MKENDNNKPLLVLDAGRDPESRAVAFHLLADQAKSDIHRLDNGGQWEVSIAIPSSDASSNEIRLYARTRRDLEASIDRQIGALIDPAKARALYAYFASLRRRGELGGLEIAGDMITPEGEIVNIDAKASEPQ